MAKKIDLTNKIFNNWKVIQQDLSRIGTGAYWICQCLNCGKEKSVKGQYLREKGSQMQCDCNKSPIIKDTTSLINKRFGRLVVLERDLSKPCGRKNPSYWICQCDCGNICTVSHRSLVTGHTQSCGCYRKELLIKRNTLDLTNKRFGILTALINTQQLSTHNSFLWKCKCDCGNICIYSAETLMQGRTLSCGCNHGSLGEKEIEQILIDNNIAYQREYSFTDLINTNTNYKYRFDFAIFDSQQNIIRLIEFDGEQHFKEKPNSHFNFIEIQKSDSIKNQYAIQHHIPLIRIPYTELNKITFEMLFSNKYLIKESI